MSRPLKGALGRIDGARKEVILWVRARGLILNSFKANDNTFVVEKKQAMYWCLWKT